MQSAQAVEQGARYLVPVHLERFRLGHEPMDEGAQRRRRALADEPERLLAVDVGLTFRVPLVWLRLFPGRIAPTTWAP